MTQASILLVPMNETTNSAGCIRHHGVYLYTHMYLAFVCNVYILECKSIMLTSSYSLH